MENTATKKHFLFFEITFCIISRKSAFKVHQSVFLFHFQFRSRNYEDENFMDGLVMLYYGNEKTRMVFYTQCDLMFKGQTQMFVHDKSGYVVYLETQEGKGDLAVAIKKTSDCISRLNEGIKLLIAVEREVWGVENFIYLKDERMVTWEKFCNQDELHQIDKALFTDEIYYSQRHWLLFEDIKEYDDKDKSCEFYAVLLSTTKA